MRCFYIVFVLGVCECSKSEIWSRREDIQKDVTRESDYAIWKDGNGDYTEERNYNDKSRDVSKEYGGRFDENDEIDKRYGVSLYGYGEDGKYRRYYEPRYNDRQYNDERDGKLFIDDRRYRGHIDLGRRKYWGEDACRYIGPLYDYRKLNKLDYRVDRYNTNKGDAFRYNSEKLYGRCEMYDGKIEDIVRPCSVNDYACIRKFLAGNSDCKPVYGPRPDPIIIPVDKFFIPVVNLTITHTNLRVRGFDSANITDFYLNKETGNLVIAINVKNVNQTSPKSFFTYQRTAREPIVLADFTSVTYSSITFTAVLPFYPRLRLDKAEIHAFVDDRQPTYNIGPKIFASADPDVIDAFAQFNLNLATVIQEAYVFQSFLLTGVYIQKSICDFGVDVYGNYIRFIKSKGFVVSPLDYKSFGNKDLRNKY